MVKFFEKYEIICVIGLICLYIILNSYCIQNFGITDFRSSIVNTIFSVFLIILIILLKKSKRIWTG